MQKCVNYFNGLIQITVEVQNRHNICFCYPLCLRVLPFLNIYCQWRRQDLLRGGAKLEIMSWDTHGGLQSRVQQLLDD